MHPRPVGTFQIVPSLPPRLERLRELAYNLRWSWEHDTIDLFRRLDRELWDQVEHNPVLLLGRINQQRLAAAAQDDGFLAHLDRVTEAFDAYLAPPHTWFGSQVNRGVASSRSPLIAYFSFEFGLTECLHLYSGGLGILSGDHLKSASDLGLPLVAVGLLYQQGYLRQRLSRDGWQNDDYPENDSFTLPLTAQRLADGSPLRVQLQWPKGQVTCRVWRTQVGRVPLFLLDTNLPENAPPERDITDRLYGGDVHLRILQELVLGVGGSRVLTALGYTPSVYHMNEGHAAFLGLERIRFLMQTPGVSFAAAREAAAAGNVFTTHTPVPAGIDLFPPELMDTYFREWYDALGISRDQFLALGRQDSSKPDEPFSMALLALRLSRQANGVSELHGQVARRMWAGVWPDLPVEEVPISAVTNGVHLETWIADDVGRLYDRYLGPRWRESPADSSGWRAVEDIPAEELWRTHERCRERLVSVARQRLRRQLTAANAPAAEIEQAVEVLNPAALTIGFARRFATYKRATLIFSDPERLAALLTNRAQPVQLIFGGKAHPQDEAAKELIRQVVQMARQGGFRHHIVFLEDYDMDTARCLVQGTDVWLTTPRRPLEASGTSGMKAVLNGALHLSVLDGWWSEGYGPEYGWAIGSGEEYADPDQQDQVEAQSLYALLETDVAPLFYERGADGLPRGWIGRMKSSIQALAPRFSTHRMVQQYTQTLYLPAAERFRHLAADGLAAATDLARWKQRLHRGWDHVRVADTRADLPKRVQVGDTVTVRAWVEVGTIPLDDLRVELIHGAVTAHGQLTNTSTLEMLAEAPGRGSAAVFQAAIPCQASGACGYTVRVLPQHPDLAHSAEMGLVRWA